MVAWLQTVPCPKCGAKEGDRCRSLTTNRTTDTHLARIDAYYTPKPPPSGQDPTT